MLLLVSRGGCREAAEKAKRLLYELAGVEVVAVGSRDYGGCWAGLLARECYDLEQARCDTGCNEEAVKTKRKALIKVVEELVQNTHVSEVLVAAIPLLPPWGPAIVADGPVYAAWLRRDVPVNSLEDKIYRVILARVVAMTNPLLAASSLHTPWIAVEELARRVGAREVGDGFLFVPDAAGGQAQEGG